MEEGVEEVDGQEAQVSQPFQESLHAGVTDLWHLAGVQRLTEADVHIVFMQSGIRPTDMNEQIITINSERSLCLVSKVKLKLKL